MSLAKCTVLENCTVQSMLYALKAHCLPEPLSCFGVQALEYLAIKKQHIMC